MDLGSCCPPASVNPACEVWIPVIAPGYLYAFLRVWELLCCAKACLTLRGGHADVLYIQQTCNKHNLTPKYPPPNTPFSCLQERKTTQNFNNASATALIVIRFADLLGVVWHSLHAHTHVPQASHRPDSNGQNDADEKSPALNGGRGWMWPPCTADSRPRAGTAPTAFLYDLGPPPICYHSCHPCLAGAEGAWGLRDLLLQRSEPRVHTPARPLTISLHWEEGRKSGLMLLIKGDRTWRLLLNRFSLLEKMHRACPSNLI